MSHQTALADLHDLARRGLLVASRHGRGYAWTESDDLRARLRPA